MFVNGKRIADDNIYLNEDRYNKPKELFKFIGKNIIESAFPDGSALFDAGCATGELLYYLKQILPNFSSFYGMDISERMIRSAQEHVRGVNFFVGSMLDDKLFQERRWDVVTCLGVLSIFDDFQQPLENLLACVREGGLILISGIFNDDPIDVVMRYRRSDKPQGIWETGWNTFSRYTIEKSLASSGYLLKWNWEAFRMPFALEKKPQDPMRSWTIAAGDNPHQLVNGACQLLNLQTLAIKILKTKT